MNPLARPLDTIMMKAPPKSSRWTLYAVGALFATLIIWSSVARLDVVTVAEGRLVPETLVKIVQPAEAGSIRQILVHDGDHVLAGQVLVRMNSEMLDADRRTTDTEAALRSLALRRIDAELGDTALLSKPSDSASQFARVNAQYQAHRKAYADSIAQEDATIQRSIHELSAARQGVDKLKATVPIYQQAAAAFEKLAKDGFVNEIAYREKDRDRIEKEQDLLSQQASTQSLGAALDQARRKKDQVVSNYRSQLHNERVEVESQAEKFYEDGLKANYRAGLYELKASQAGVVKDLATTTVGAVIAPGTVLLSLVPVDEPLVADVVIRNEDVSFLATGLAVKVKVLAYPFQKYGMLDGTVTRIASDATESKGADGVPKDQPNYRAEVQLRRQDLSTGLPEKLPLSAGMRVSAEIRQRDQTVFEYLISPIQRVAMEAGHER